MCKNSININEINFHKSYVIADRVDSSNSKILCIREQIGLLYQVYKNIKSYIINMWAISQSYENSNNYDNKEF